ncbi:alpha and gamma adaptin binding protein p34-domain-containing protein [Rhypophila decipiens]|uniref:Alpha and gamma adaptin binding protein p34-domain-containing protein n=1 Tax=Rhypophila decipiens TaxID=261697 RepID=A0AAN7B5I5_9PEZI|nr:alpha and gamma adaptin binding protein p34-domain-containing protein [Rhypophila decipiens]
MAEISNPRRILAVSLADSAEHLSLVIKDLTGTLPEPAVIPPPSDSSDPSAPPSTTLAGTTHVLPLKTTYYTASVPIWLDLISSPEEWSASFLSDEAKEVLDVLGGVLVIFPLQSSSASAAAAAAKDLVSHVGRVIRQGLGGTDWEGVGLVVGVSSSSSSGSPRPLSSLPPGGEDNIAGGGREEDLDAILDEWEDYCWDSGLEFVHHRVTITHPKAQTGASSEKKDAEKGEKDERNEFGEKMGIARVREALEANEWSGGAGGGSDDDESDDAEEEGEFGSFQKGKQQQSKKDGEESDDDEEQLDFGFDKADFVGLKKAIWKGGGDDEDDDDDDEANGNDDEVKKLESMMHKLQAVRDMTAGMPDEQRKRMAKHAVDEVMKDMEL